MPIMILLIVNLVIVSLIQKRVHIKTCEGIVTRIPSNYSEPISIPKRNIISIIRFQNQVSRFCKQYTDNEIRSLLSKYRLYWIYAYVSMFLCLGSLAIYGLEF